VRWLTGFETAGTSVAVPGGGGPSVCRRFPEGLLSPRIGRVPLSTLREEENQADYLVDRPAGAPAGGGAASRAAAEPGSFLPGGVLRGDHVGVRGTPSPRRRRSRRSSLRLAQLAGVLRPATCSSSGTRRTTRGGRGLVVGVSPAGPLAKTSYLWTASDRSGRGERGGPPARPGDREAPGDDSGAGGDAGREAPGVGGLGPEPRRPRPCSWPTTRIRAASSSGTWRTSDEPPRRQAPTTLKLRELGAETPCGDSGGVRRGHR